MWLKKWKEKVQGNTLVDRQNKRSSKENYMWGEWFKERTQGKKEK
jgi:hypothetical protein